MSASRLIRKNIFANYFGAIATIAAPIIALPFYLNLLGPRLFGLISFVTSLQVALTLLDSGISQVAVREFSLAMDRASRGSRRAADLLFNLERIYWIIALSAALGTAALADVIARHWLRLDAETVGYGRQAVLGSAALFAVQFPGSLYRSFLVASQAQVALNYIVVSGTVIRHAGAILLLLVDPSLAIYLGWHFAVTFAETLVRATTSWRSDGMRRRDSQWCYAFVRPLLPVIAKLSGAVLLGALATQLDRIILSRMVSIEQFGYYAIASTLSLGILNLVYPLMQAVSPKIMQSARDPASLRKLNLRLTFVLSSMVLAGAIAFLTIGRFVLGLWLHNPTTEAVVHDLLSILLIGSALNALYHVGYFNWLAHGATRNILLVNALSLASSLIFIPLFVRAHGLIGATFGFVAMNVLGVILSLGWLRTRPASTA